MEHTFYRPNKIIDPVKALKLLNKTENVVFTSGCFDILHFGHIYLLRKAKALVQENGKLLVAVHDDESIRKKKGENRPINNLNYRMELLSELISVDFVMPWYGWEDIINFVTELSPKYIAISDKSFRGKTIAKVSREIGSQLKVFRSIDNMSTTQILQSL